MSQSKIDLGMVSLPVLCCLLMAVIYVGFISIPDTKNIGEAILDAEAKMNATQSRVMDTAKKLEDDIEAKKISGELAVSNQGLKATIAELERRQKALEADLLRRTKDRNDKETQRLNLQQTLQEKQVLLEEAQKDDAAVKSDIDTLKREIDSLATQIRDIDEQLSSVQDLITRYSVAIGPAGAYTGPRVVLEVTGQGAVMHPGGKVIPLDASDAEITSLNDEICKVGAVFVFVRPSGWEDSDDKFCSAIRTLVADSATKGKVASYFWPVEEDYPVQIHCQDNSGSQPGESRRTSTDNSI